MIWLFVHLAPPWQDAHAPWNTVAPAVTEASPDFGALSARTVWPQVVSKSRASLPPCCRPWSKMAGFGRPGPVPGQATFVPGCSARGSPPAKPAPHWTPRELLLKSVMLSRTALQLLIRASWAPASFEYRP